MHIEKIILLVAVMASFALSRQIPWHAELDEEEHELFRAAYDAPYEQEEYEEVETPDKLDLLKGGIWALKAKMKQMKTFDKALAAHLLATKLQVKELLATMKKPHVMIKKKPVYQYQSPPPAYHEYETSHYAPPQEQYGQYAPPQYSYQHAPPKYQPPKYEPPKYEPHKYEPHKYEPPKHEPPKYESIKYEPPKYEPPKHEPPKYESTKYEPPKYEPPKHEPPKYEPSAQYIPVQNEVFQYPAQAPAQQYNHDPYYGY